MAMDGYADEGIAHATSTLGSLPVELRSDRLIHNVARDVLAAVPVPIRRAPSVAEYRDLLAATPTA